MAEEGENFTLATLLCHSWLFWAIMGQRSFNKTRSRFDSSSVQTQPTQTVMDVDIAQNAKPEKYMNKATISENMKMRIELLMFRIFICCTFP